MKILSQNKKGLIEAAIGKKPCDLIIKNAKILNVFTGEVYEGEIGIFEGFIAHINCDPDQLNGKEEYLEGENVYDAKGHYVIPGLIDAHIHIESTLLTPRNFAKAAIPHGTTTIITDPHEIANVYGIRGVEYMHAPFLSGRELSAYLCGGPNTDHESRTSKEARDKIRNGMYVDARESSISKNVEAIVEGVKSFKYLDYLTLCTDDREADEILEKGHMNDVIRSAIKAGLDPIDAIRCATLNTAREVGITNLGAIAPSYVADLLVVEDLEKMDIKSVFFNGKLVAEDGILLEKIEDKVFKIEEENSVIIEQLELENFRLKAPIQNGTVKTKVIKYLSQLSSSTEIVEEDLPVKGGYIDLSHDTNLNFVSIINRHGKLDTKSIGVVRNFGTQKGAVGSTVSHDSHNLTIVYEDSKEALLVARDLMTLGGGISCAVEGEIKEHLQLSVAGLMSRCEAQELAQEAKQMKKALQEMGIDEMKNPLLRIATLALPVIPKGKMSDLGVVDVLKKELVDLF